MLELKEKVKVQLLVDSGASRHVCPHEWQQGRATVVPGADPRLYNADGHKLVYYDTREADLLFDGFSSTFKIRFASV